ncbi:acyltransferase family protein [Flavobacterium sp. Arc2]|jgi:predicted acyltransferase|uniref:acyltransferase family protein n=1 Tax=Flavobacterium sp. Arc2 TaxID=3046685 RepID=UPI00352E4B43
MKNDRIISVDILRGMTILLMIIVNNPGNWGAVYTPLLHAKWNGCTPTDLVFPTFIFVLGIAIPLAMPKKTWNQETFIKIITRTLRIISLGLFLNFFSKIFIFSDNQILLLFVRLSITILVGYALLGNFNPKVKLLLAVSIFTILLFLAYSGIESFNDVRLPGVLQRIGIVYLIATVIYLKTELETQIGITIALLIGYWALLTIIPVPGIGTANYNEGTNLSSWLDSFLLEGHMYGATKTWDPEGILSTLPAIATALIGLIIGKLILTNESKIKIIKKMAAIAFVLTTTGLLWSFVFPLNKSLWTSSYVLYSAGIALFILAVLHYITEVKGAKKGFFFFLIWGVNPMIVFFLSGILPRALGMITFPNPENADAKISVLSYAYQFWINPNFDNEKSASLTYALLYASLWSLLLWFFYKKKLFFKV